MQTAWHLHPDSGIESLLRTGGVAQLSAALSHQRIHSDPYARLRVADRLAELAPGSAEIEQQWIQLMLMSNRPSPVWQLFSRKLSENSLPASEILLAAQVAQVVGERNCARALYLRALEQSSGSGDAWQKYVEFEHQEQLPATVTSALQSLLQKTGSAYETEKLTFALAMGLRHTEPDRAFGYAIRAQALKRRRLPPWDQPQLESRLANDRAWTPEHLTVASGFPRFVFVVGLPRSGTTLLSSLLGAHTAMANVGEQNLVASLALGPCRTAMEEVPGKLVDFSNRWYSAAVGDLCQGKPISVDKLPANLEFCGLILSLFPGATIVHIQRDLDDCAASIHMHDFDFGCAYSMAADTIGRYFSMANAHLDHWKSIAPERVFTIKFEEMIAAPAQALSKLLDHLGISWEAAMLDFWMHKTGTATFSESQVRRPLNTQGVGHAGRLEPAATPFLDELHAAVFGPPVAIRGFSTAVSGAGN